MKLRFLTYSLMAMVLVLNSCKDDESPKSVFVFDGEAYSLKGANLYLTNSGNCCNNHDYRDYFITDGTYTNDGGEQGWVMGDYTNATYFLAVEIGVPGESDFAPGNFPQSSNWVEGEGLGLDANVGYIYLEAGSESDYIEYYSDNENEVASPIAVSGGFDDGEKMTIKFSGTLSYYHYDGENWIEETVTGKFYFTGTVQDERVG